MKKRLNILLVAAAMLIAFAGVNTVMAQPENLALNKKAKQSSNQFPTDGLAGNAVDGEVDGDWFHGSVTHTVAESNPWWEVDLGTISAVNKIEIWNRTDAGQERLTKLIIWVRRSTRDNWVAFSPGMHTFKQNETYPLTFEGDKQVRYVRIQLLDSNAILHLAEVKVWKAASEDDYWNAIKDSKRPEDFQHYLDKYPNGKYQTIARFSIDKYSDPTTPGRTADPVEEQFWNMVKDSKKASDFQAYLKEYPQGRYAPIARLKANPAPVPTPTPVVLPTPKPSPPPVVIDPQPTPTPINAEDQIWNMIKDSQRPEDFDVYLNDFPNGKYATLARLKKSRLTPDEPDPVPPPHPEGDDEDEDGLDLVRCTVDTQSGNLNLRSYSGQLIGSLPKGSVVYINQEERSRVNVSEKRRTGYVVLGWVATRFLSCDR